ncbi:hypothetical protein OG897_14660 [Streptomyces sp. NBC_00237]|uniref:hypothetical protein n=1 Tax=Streptomyces sp. NBC_00237 TaxID=2975687 RepID=UPI0022581AA2|nr:hypothetical protein [Streptomyces sp. NBC_00237]MCX5202686.1 hypothetical protein [Streptomyces sp. NBC_00237]
MRYSPPPLLTSALVLVAAACALTASPAAASTTAAASCGTTADNYAGRAYANSQTEITFRADGTVGYVKLGVSREGSYTADATSLRIRLDATGAEPDVELVSQNVACAEGEMEPQLIAFSDDVDGTFKDLP